MLRPVRLLPPSLRTTTPSHLLRISQRHQRRPLSLSTPPSKKPRSFKGGLVRWGLAGAALYWYTTRDVDVFAEDARSRLRQQQQQQQQKHAILETQDVHEELPTVDDMTEARRRRLVASSAAADTEAAVVGGGATAAAAAGGAPSPSGGSPASLEEEAQSEGAFNEETGEINWDCPCLGGMAHGPCGEHFREAFSCFVYSKEEPKGVDCIERFKTMQDCFREHPDVYGAELTDDELDPDSDAAEGAATEGGADAQPLSQPQPQAQSQSQSQTSAAAEQKSDKA